MTIKRQYDERMSGLYVEGSSSLIEVCEGRKFIKEHLGRFMQDWPQGNSKPLLADMGCGNGVDLPSYRKMGFDVVGIEPSRAQRQLKISSVPKIRKGDFENSPLETCSAEVLVSRFAIHYTSSLERAFAETARTLKPGGLFLYVTSNPRVDTIQSNECDLVKANLYGGRVLIEFYLHTMEEYFSATFYRHFSLLSVYEYIGRERDGEFDRPNVLCVAAVRR